jgi:D-3-phosphoglycerate dehydrogenase / 2-oxoglutarate reductase
MIGILEPSNFSVSALGSLRKIGKVKVFEGKNLKAFLKDVTILFVRLNHQLDEDMLNNARHLQIICTPTTGLNHIDLSYCKSRHIKIISLKGETTFLKTIRATPEHTLGLLLALYRNYHTAFLSRDNGVWDRDVHRGYEIFNSNIGIIGLGRVGSIVASYLLAMGAKVAYYDIVEKKTDKKLRRLESMEQLIKESDAIILCSSYDIEAGAIIRKKQIDLMAGKYFVNTARAELTDEEYLLEKASKDYMKGVAIDVITNEQTTQPTLKRWLVAGTRSNIIVTPHIGGATYTSMARTEEFIVGKLASELGKK